MFSLVKWRNGGIIEASHRKRIILVYELELTDLNTGILFNDNLK